MEYISFSLNEKFQSKINAIVSLQIVFQLKMLCCACSAPTKPVFGIPINEVPRSTEDRFVPTVVDECKKYIEKLRNINSTGLYYNSGQKDDIESLKQRVKKNDNVKNAEIELTSSFSFIRLTSWTITSA